MAARAARSRNVKYRVCTDPVRATLSHAGQLVHDVVFSEALTRRTVHLGRALAVLCVRPVHTVEALVEEAEHLWAAEGTPDLSKGRISASWGRVALALNPSRSVPQELVKGWSDRVAQEADRRLCRAKDERDIVNAGGLLAIPGRIGQAGCPWSSPHCSRRRRTRRSSMDSTLLLKRLRAPGNSPRGRGTLSTSGKTESAALRRFKTMKSRNTSRTADPHDRPLREPHFVALLASNASNPGRSL